LNNNGTNHTIPVLGCAASEVLVVAQCKQASDVRRSASRAQPELLQAANGALEASGA
jgi:hypothetical protein